MENDKALNIVVNNLDLLEFNSDQKSNDEQFAILVAFIDDLIRNDFNRLVSILYRVDISEAKLKQKLAENTDIKIPAAETIARLFIAREEEKIISRAKYRREQ